MGFLGGQGLTIRDLTLDWDPPPFTQGTITDLADGGRRLVLTVDEGYPSPTHEMFTVAHHAGALLHRADGSFIGGAKLQGSPVKRFTDVSPLGGRRYEMHVGGKPAVNTRGLAEGRRLVHGARSAKGLTFMNVDDITLEGVTVRTAPGMAISGAFCSNPTLHGVTVAPAPSASRLAGPIADGINFSNGKMGPRIEDCHLAQLRDDAIVVDTIMATVGAVVDDRTIELEPGGRPSVEPGDVLDVITPNGVRTGALPPVTDITYRKNLPHPWVPDIPNRLTFEASIRDAVSVADSLANRTQTNRDFVVRNNTVRETAANALRLGSGPGRVEGNTFTGTGRHPIVAVADTGDATSHKRWTNDVLIRNNDLSRAGLTYFAAANPAGILVDHRAPDWATAEGRPHRNIVAEGNRVDHGAALGIDVRQAEAVTLRGNEIFDVNRLVYRDGGGFGIGLDHVVDATVTDNHVAGRSDTLYQFGWERRSREVTAADNTVAVGDQSVQAALIRWTPIHLTFDHTERPDGGHRYIAFRCASLALLDAQDDPLAAVDIGGREMPVDFGAGVYSVDEVDGDRWRWLGGPNRRATIFVPKQLVAEATRLRLRGRPIDDELTATVTVDGNQTDRLTFTTGPSTYDANLR
ncbi:MAG: right-handed parallel beta-helix repeat-containing protein [Halobacteriaceae archaeon]